MKLVYKAFCRTVQLGFRIALPLLPYREPQRLSAVDDVAPLLRKMEIASVLLVTDPVLKRSGATARLEAELEKYQISCTVYDKTCPNPTVYHIEEALQQYHKGGCRGIIAFGGGASMDCAKAVGARVAYPKRSLRQMRGLLRVWRKLPPLIAIPTTAGTGSEVTVAAVITDPETHHKYTMLNFTFIPAFAVHDPAVSCSLPPHVTATTGMDALTHAVEAYIGGTTTAETRRLAREAVKLVFENLETAYQNGSDPVARKNMLQAAYSAGIAFSKSYVGYIHAVAHSLGGQYNMAYGLTNAVLLPIVLELYGDCIHEQLRDLAVEAGVAQPTDAPAVAAAAFIRAIRALNHRMEIPAKLGGIRREDIPVMARCADREANPLYPVPRLMDAKELKIIYETVADWSQA